MLPIPSNTAELFNWAQQQQLYADLLHQLQKDLQLGKIDVDVDQSVQPEALYETLTHVVCRLLQYHYETLLNFLYIIDVPESDFKKIQGDDIGVLAQQISFLILRREWMKVWFKKNWSR